MAKSGIFCLFFALLGIYGCAFKSLVSSRWPNETRKPAPPQGKISSLTPSLASSLTPSLTREKTGTPLWFVSDQMTELGIARQRNHYLALKKDGSQVFFDGRDLVGMSMSEVILSLGHPQYRDIAGNKANKYERWAYRIGKRRQLFYFKRGMVYGWETLP